MESVEKQLKTIRRNAARFEEELEGESQSLDDDDDVQLRDAEMAEYHQLKGRAGKKTVGLTQQLDKVGSCCCCLCVCSMYIYTCLYTV